MFLHSWPAISFGIRHLSSLKYKLFSLTSFGSMVEKMFKKYKKNLEIPIRGGVDDNLSGG